jgi:hypothetical protein
MTTSAPSTVGAGAPTTFTAAVTTTDVVTAFSAAGPDRGLTPAVRRVVAAVLLTGLLLAGLALVLSASWLIADRNEASLPLSSDDIADELSTRRADETIVIVVAIGAIVLGLALCVLAVMRARRRNEDDASPTPIVVHVALRNDDGRMKSDADLTSPRRRRSLMRRRTTARFVDRLTTFALGAALLTGAAAIVGRAVRDPAPALVPRGDLDRLPDAIGALLVGGAVTVVGALLLHLVLRRRRIAQAWHYDADGNSILIKPAAAHDALVLHCERELAGVGLSVERVSFDAFAMRDGAGVACGEVVVRTEGRSIRHALSQDGARATDDSRNAVAAAIGAWLIGVGVHPSEAHMTVRR